MKQKKKIRMEGLKLVENLVCVLFLFSLFFPQSGHDSSVGIQLQSSRTKSNTIPPAPQRSNHTFNCKSIESSYSNNEFLHVSQQWIRNF